jgi:thiazole synthase ThiGH ThiG subunit
VPARQILCHTAAEAVVTCLPGKSGCHTAAEAVVTCLPGKSVEPGDEMVISYEYLVD